MTSENLSGLRSLIGKKPNERWMFVSVVLMLSGAAVYLGLTEAFGFKLNPTSAHAPLVVMMFALGIGIYATVLAKTAQIVQKNHELAMEDKRKSDRPKSEPTEGDDIFWSEFKQNSPMSAKQLESMDVKHDKDKTKAQLLATIAHLRMSGWIGRGKAVEYGNTYYTRDQYKDKLDNSTVFVNRGE